MGGQQGTKTRDVESCKKLGDLEFREVRSFYNIMLSVSHGPVVVGLLPRAKQVPGYTFSR